jgi:hypothetical protein
MKKISQPPLVILLDVLFIFLFVSILEKPPKIAYEIPKEKLFKGAYIMSTNALGEKKIYDVNKQIFSDNFSFATSSHGFYFTQTCAKQIECQEARLQTQDELNIVITGQSYDDIARLTFIGCNIDPSQCSNIIFPINETGKINKEKLLAYNPFFGEIEGFLKSEF